MHFSVSNWINSWPMGCMNFNSILLHCITALYFCTAHYSTASLHYIFIANQFALKCYRPKHCLELTWYFPNKSFWLPVTIMTRDFEAFKITWLLVIVASVLRLNGPCVKLLQTSWWSEPKSVWTRRRSGSLGFREPWVRRTSCSTRTILAPSTSPSSFEEISWDFDFL